MRAPPPPPAPEAPPRDKPAENAPRRGFLIAGTLLTLATAAAPSPAA